MKLRIKTILYLSLLSALALSLPGCKSDCSEQQPENQKGADHHDTVSPSIFGANLDWIHLAAFTMEHGDIIRDRSFRSTPYDDEEEVDNEDDKKVKVWHKYTEAGIYPETDPDPSTRKITWNTTEPGDINPAGGKSYIGYVELYQNTPAFTGISQFTMVGIESGQNYQIYFSSFGYNSTPNATVYLYDTTTPIPNILASSSITAANNEWTQHSVTLSPSASESNPKFGICLTSAGTIRIDEVRMFRTGSMPTVKTELKTAIQDLGVKSLRWPGGTLVDWFTWTDSIGPVISRGELQAYQYYETPALGLHEFLNLCEELELEPFVMVNVLKSAADAANLVEYILGPSGSTQGTIRAANGRANPWEVKYFEIGNEPINSYSGGSVPDTGAYYASQTKLIIAAMEAKSESLGKKISFGAINEPCFQMADWLVPGVINEDVDLLYYWNSQVFDTVTGIKNADFTNGHFYSSRFYDTDEEIRFRYAMTGGKLLDQTIQTKIEAVTSIPFWLTEYNIVIVKKIDEKDVVQVEYLKDFQSGLAIADILMYIIKRRLPGAHIYNLIDTNGFGILLDHETGSLRPTGHIFRLFSVMADEKLLDVKVDNDSSYTIATGNGNVPAGFSYPLITAIATKNSATGKARVMLLNRDYGNDITFTIDFKGFTPGDADLHRYENNDLGENNETVENVSISTESITIDSPFSVTLPAHSLWRIDFK